MGPKADDTHCTNRRRGFQTVCHRLKHYRTQSAKWRKLSTNKNMHYDAGIVIKLVINFIYFDEHYSILSTSTIDHSSCIYLHAFVDATMQRRYHLTAFVLFAGKRALSRILRSDILVASEIIPLQIAVIHYSVIVFLPI